MKKNIATIITFLENKKNKGVKNVFVSTQNLQKLKSYTAQLPSPNNKIPELTTKKKSQEISTPKIPPQKSIENNLQEKKSLSFHYQNKLKKASLLVLVDPSFNAQILTYEQQKLLHKMLTAISLDKDKVCILAIQQANLEEITQELTQLAPQFILIMGARALKQLKIGASLAQEHGKWFTFATSQVCTTYHPQFLINNPKYKRQTWVVLQEIQQKLSLRE